MKTLDEVIERLEDDLHAAEADSQLIMLFDRNVVDAIHYLKEYRSKQDTIAEQLAELEQKNDHVCEMAKTVCEEYDRLCNRLAEEYRNDPLSWEELKAMEGKPVWVDAGKFGSHWYLIEEICPNESIVCLGKFHESITLYHEDILTYWQSYRKERLATGGSLTPDPKSKKIGDDTEIKWSEKNDKELEH